MNKILLLLLTLGLVACAISPSEKALNILREVPIENKAYYHEDEDYGVPPTDKPTAKFEGNTPTTHPKARVISTYELREQLLSDTPPLLIQASYADRTTLPTAKVIFRLYRGSYSEKSEQLLKKFTHGDKNKAIVVFCADSKCWFSYNAIFTLSSLGYTNLYWYRGGLNSWDIAGLPFEAIDVSY